MGRADRGAANGGGPRALHSWSPKPARGESSCDDVPRLPRLSTSWYRKSPFSPFNVAIVPGVVTPTRDRGEQAWGPGHRPRPSLMLAVFGDRCAASYIERTMR